MLYTPHEIRLIIRNCETIGELYQLELFLLLEGCYYSLLQHAAFNAGILRQKLKITGNYAA